MGLEPTQDRDRNGDRSNSYSREVARERLATDANLSSEDRKYLENQTICQRGEGYRSADKARLVVSDANASGEQDKEPPTCRRGEDYRSADKSRLVVSDANTSGGQDGKPPSDVNLAEHSFSSDIQTFRDQAHKPQEESNREKAK